MPPNRYPAHASADLTSMIQWRACGSLKFLACDLEPLGVEASMNGDPR